MIAGYVVSFNYKRIFLYSDVHSSVILRNKRALITGANQGFGLAIAQAFAAGGADIAICARNEELLASAGESLQSRHPGIRVHAVDADIGSRRSVDDLYASVERAFGGLDIVVCNAGVLGPTGRVDDVDWDSWMETLRINLIGTAYCARRALQIMTGPGRGKMLIVSGGGATKPMPYFSAYAASKAGLVRFGESLAEELRERNIDVNMIAPGALNTRLLDEVIGAGPDNVGPEYYAASLRQRETGGASIAHAAELCVFLASQASDGISGKLVSAPWDPWERFGAEARRLSGDVYTLRRIIPEDRGWSW